jgi:hypothetical protein
MNTYIVHLSQGGHLSFSVSRSYFKVYLYKQTCEPSKATTDKTVKRILLPHNTE